MLRSTAALQQGTEKRPLVSVYLQKVFVHLLRRSMRVQFEQRVALVAQPLFVASESRDNPLELDCIENTLRLIQRAKKVKKKNDMLCCR